MVQLAAWAWVRNKREMNSSSNAAAGGRRDSVDGGRASHARRIRHLRPADELKRARATLECLENEVKAVEAYIAALHRDQAGLLRDEDTAATTSTALEAGRSGRPRERPRSIPADMERWIFPHLQAATDAICAYEASKGKAVMRARGMAAQGVSGVKGRTGIYICAAGCPQSNVEWRVRIPNRQSGTVWITKAVRHHVCPSGAVDASESDADAEGAQAAASPTTMSV